jgi:RNA polymerase sigma factor (sigma-70 family)
MADVIPPELSGLLHSADVAAREAAWAAFLAAHSRLLLHTARSLGHDYDTAMDAYAYLLEQLQKDDFHRLRAYAADGRSKFTTWLVVVARRLCVDFQRHRYGRVRDVRTDARDARLVRRRLTDLLAEELDLNELGTDSANPETDLLARERAQTMTAALDTLGARDRLLLTLRFEDDLSAREIGEVMGFPTPFHVYRRLTVVLRSLRRGLEDRGVRGAGS